nr:transposase [Acidithiobacillus thiooxidans]
MNANIDADRYITFLTALIQDAHQKIYLVVDNLRVHHAKVVTAWLADKKTALNWPFCRPTRQNPTPTNT